MQRAMEEDIYRRERMRGIACVLVGRVREEVGDGCLVRGAVEKWGRLGGEEERGEAEGMA